MHDPMCVAYEIKLPIPKREQWREQHAPRQWGIEIARRTNPENLGERVYPWWRPKGYRLWLAGRTWSWRPFLTVWHVEPDGHDSGSVCRHGLFVRDMTRFQRLCCPKRRREQIAPGDRGAGGEYGWTSAWRLHVHHWHIQWHLEQKVHRWFFERCLECGRRFPWGYAPVSHQWDSPKSKWWTINKTAYHHECSSLVTMRSLAAQDQDALRSAVAAYRLTADLSELDAIDHIGRAAQASYDAERPFIRPDGTKDYGRDGNVGYRTTNRLLRACGWQYKSEYASSFPGRDACVEFRGSLYHKILPAADKETTT